ncbi:MAG: hypothetical protein EBU08_17745, partial [Micrococcales bacterium]|nr:hypothetical protein [Micrococcales bacterium]
MEEGTTEVAVTVVTVDPDASVEVEGDTDLVSGENTLTVTVTAADGETTAEYTITLVVAPSTDTSLATLQVNGVDLIDGESLDLAPYTTEVDVNVVTTNPDATFEIDGGSELVPGENALTVTVTAADGVTAQIFTITLVVALGNNTNLTSLQVNGEDVTDGSTVDLAPYTTEVEVSAEAEDPDATYEVTGSAELQPGENILVVTVTAADDYASQDYVIILNVAFGNNVELATFQVNGNDVADGDLLELEPYTTEVDVTVETVDPDSTFVINGASNLLAGENILTVAVVAADGTSAEYSVILVVALGNNVALATFQVNGEDVVDGDVVELYPYTTDVDIVVETVDEDATYEITGGSELQTGENTLTVTVTAADGETTQDYNVTLNVALGDSTDLSSFTVNGDEVSDGDTVELAPLTTEVEVAVVTTDANATFEIEGGSDLLVGD